MHVTFTPALGEVARLVTTGPFGVDGKTASAQDLVFKATFDSRESYEQAKRDGVRVEMWTDLPVLEQPGWEWAALAFEEPAKAAQVHSSRKALSLVSPDVRPAIHGEENALYAKLSVRLHAYTPGHQFSFTYRLVYPSGEIRWLGEYGHNGVLVVERGVVPAALGVHLNESWNVGSDGKAETEVAGLVEREVGRLSGELNWSTWAIEENSWPVLSRTSKTRPSSAIILLPQTRTHAIVSPQPIILRATSGASVHITSEGHILCTTGGHLSLRTVDQAGHTDLGGILIVKEPTSLYVTVGGLMPVSVLVVPLHDTPADLEVHVQRKFLASLLPPSEQDVFALCSPSTQDFCTLVEDEISLHIGPFGGHLLLAPVHTLETTREPEEGKWNISFFHHNTHVKVSEVKEEVEIPQRVLPTPPPSPPPVHRAAVQRPPPIPLPSFSEVSEHFTSVTSSTVTSVATSPAIPTPSVSPTSSTIAEPLTPFPLASRHENQADPDAFALMRVQNQQALHSYLLIVLAMFTSLWQMLLQKVVLLLAGISGSEIVQSGSVVNLNRSENGDLTEVEQSNPTDMSGQETATGGESAEAEKIGDVVTDDHSVDVSVQSPEPDIVGILREPQSSVASPSAAFEKHAIVYRELMRDAPPVLSRPALTADVRSHNGKLSMLVQAPTACSTLASLKFMLNDEHVIQSEIDAFERDGYHLVNIQTPTGFESGNMTVTFA